MVFSKLFERLLLPIRRFVILAAISESLSIVWLFARTSAADQSAVPTRSLVVTRVIMLPVNISLMASQIKMKQACIWSFHFHNGLIIF